MPDDTLRAAVEALRNEWADTAYRMVTDERSDERRIAMGRHLQGRADDLHAILAAHPPAAAPAQRDTEGLADDTLQAVDAFADEFTAVITKVAPRSWRMDDIERVFKALSPCFERLGVVVGQAVRAQSDPAHDAEVAAKAWSKGLRAGRAYYLGRDARHLRNPYVAPEASP